MIFSRTTEYALRVMSYMASEESELFRADDLCEKLGIPKRYLRRLMTDLANHGLLNSTRGRNGGFRFARVPSEIFIAEIVNATEGFDSLNPCIMGFSECALKTPCPMHGIWGEIKDRILTTLQTVTLGQMNKKA
jgi:Rrf2 family protein